MTVKDTKDNVWIPITARTIKDGHGFDYLRHEGIRKVFPLLGQDILSNGALPPPKNISTLDTLVPFWRIHCANVKNGCSMKGKVSLMFYCC